MYERRRRAGRREFRPLKCAGPSVGIKNVRRSIPAPRFEEKDLLPVFLLVALLLLVLLILLVLTVLFLILIVLRHEGTPPFRSCNAVADQSGESRFHPYRRYFCQKPEKYSTLGKKDY